jgi:hypothetical protein
MHRTLQNRNNNKGNVGAAILAIQIAILGSPFVVVVVVAAAADDDSDGCCRACIADKRYNINVMQVYSDKSNAIDRIDTDS